MFLKTKMALKLIKSDTLYIDMEPQTSTSYNLKLEMPFQDILELIKLHGYIHENMFNISSM